MKRAINLICGLSGPGWFFGLIKHDKDEELLHYEKSAGWYINKARERVALCSGSDAIQFALEYFNEDRYDVYDFMLEWSHGTIEEWQEDFNAWKAKQK